MTTVSADVLLNRRRSFHPKNLSSAVISSPRRNNYPPGSGHPRESSKTSFFLKNSHSAENESLNPTPYFYTLQKPYSLYLHTAEY